MFLRKTPKWCLFFFMKDEKDISLVPDLTDPDEAKKAFIASEILNRKY